MYIIIIEKLTYVIKIKCLIFRMARCNSKWDTRYPHFKTVLTLHNSD